jgi:hypothetical protein
MAGFGRFGGLTPPESARMATFATFGGFEPPESAKMGGSDMGFYRFYGESGHSWLVQS